MRYAAALLLIGAAVSHQASAQLARFKPGLETTYRIEYWNRARSDFRKLFGDTTTYEPSPLSHDIVSEVRGTIAQTVLSSDTVVIAAVKLGNLAIKLLLNDIPASDAVEQMQKNLVRPVLVRMQPDGRITGLVIDSAVDEMSKAFLRAVLATTQFASPEGFADREQWNSLEEDQAGQFVATYRRTGPLTFEKTSATYKPQASVMPNGSTLDQVVTPSGKLTGILDRSGILVSLKGTTHHDAVIGTKSVAWAETRLDIERIGSRRVDLSALTTLARRSSARQWLGFYDLDWEQKGDTTIARSQLSDETLAHLKQRLSDLETNGKDSLSTTDLYLDFKALVFLHPESTGDIADILQSAKPNSQSMLILSEALSATGNPQAQSALARVINLRKTEWPVLASLIPALGSVNEPTDEAVAVMLEMTRSTDSRIASTARLAAGTMARRLRAKNTARANEIVQKLAGDSIALQNAGVSERQEWDSTSTTQVAPGVTHRRLVQNSGPWRINLLEVDLAQPGLSIRAMKAKDSFLGKETVSSMAARYKGPGKVIGAINGDFFNIKTGESENNVVIEGDLSKGTTVSDSPYDKFNAVHSQIEVDWKNHAYIERLKLNAFLGSHHLDGINYLPPDSSVMVLYTSAMGDSSLPDTLGRHPTLLTLNVLRKKGDSIWYRVNGDIIEGGRHALNGGAMIAATGKRRDEVRAIARQKGTLKLVLGFTPNHGRIRTVVGGWPVIVNDGKSVAEYADVVEGTFPRFSVQRHPRTGVGVSKDGKTLYLMTVDGRRESEGGMSLVELAQTMLRLGAYEAMNFDGGGSTTMVVDGKVVNRPSDPTGERPVGSALLIVVSGNDHGVRH